MSVDLTFAGGLLTVTLSRPDRLNALDDQMHDGIAAAIQRAAHPDVRAVVVTGAGRGFCVGQDVEQLADGRDVGALVRERYNRNIRGLRDLRKPLLAAVNGAAAGAGLSLAAACALRIASSAAVFVPAFISIGLVPDSGASHFLPRILGADRACAWMASGRRLGADEALAWGLVGEVVAVDALAARAAELGAELAALPAAAFALHRRLFERAAATTLEEQLELEAELQAEAAASAEFAEGLAAFREKRPPRFAG